MLKILFSPSEGKNPGGDLIAKELLGSNSARSDILNEYIRFMEKILIKYPDQWFNFYDFWEDDKEDKDSIRD